MAQGVERPMRRRCVRLAPGDEEERRRLWSDVERFARRAVRIGERGGAGGGQEWWSGTRVVGPRAGKPAPWPTRAISSLERACQNDIQWQPRRLLRPRYVPTRGAGWWIGGYAGASDDARCGSAAHTRRRPVFTPSQPRRLSTRLPNMAAMMTLAHLSAPKGQSEVNNPAAEAGGLHLPRER